MPHSAAQERRGAWGESSHLNGENYFRAIELDKCRILFHPEGLLPEFSFLRFGTGVVMLIKRICANVHPVAN